MYHVHVYKVVGMVQLDVDADTKEKARLEALAEVKERTLEKADCEYIALTFEE